MLNALAFIAMAGVALGLLRAVERMSRSDGT
jgi:hypothetical protein